MDLPHNVNKRVSGPASCNSVSIIFVRLVRISALARNYESNYTVSYAIHYASTINNKHITRDIHILH